MENISLHSHNVCFAQVSTISVWVITDYDMFTCHNVNIWFVIIQIVLAGWHVGGEAVPLLSS